MLNIASGFNKISAKQRPGVDAGLSHASIWHFLIHCRLPNMIGVAA